ncbi:hypothetical protein [Verminephrobacter aporrectodeae]|uniref:hypothetical protein n=1 Tax=Verminephrobacter aporrectodeae TaxID=1110389 RepID=UPI0022388DA3|nr:hypothetical protein [Verminephrobacter aporrectodeae]
MKLQTRIKLRKLDFQFGIKSIVFLLLLVIGAFIFDVLWLAKFGGAAAGFIAFWTFLGYWMGHRLSSEQLSMLEKTIFDAVREKLEPREAELWDKQIAAINKIYSSPEGLEVNFFVIRNGKPNFPPELRFTRRKKFKIADFDIEANTGTAKLRGRVWCMRGHIFSIEYRHNNSFRKFERLAQGQWHVVRCQIVNYPA